jgi:hypothetical protein
MSGSLWGGRRSKTEQSACLDALREIALNADEVRPRLPDDAPVEPVDVRQIQPSPNQSQRGCLRSGRCLEPITPLAKSS